MKELKDIRDDQIRIIGVDGERKPLRRNVWIIVIPILCVAAVVALVMSNSADESLE